MTLRRRPGARGVRRCWPSTAGTGATSCARSTAATRAPRPAGCDDDAWELFHRQLLARSFPAGIARVREHRRLGHRTLLITGALDFVVEPLRPLFDDIVCARLGRARRPASPVDSRTLPPIGEARALVLADYAADHGLALEESVAYADSASDLPMLEAVGFPVAVNPEARLAAIARRRGWHVEHWSKAAGGSHRPLPSRPAGLGPPGGGRRRPPSGRRPGPSPPAPSGRRVKALVFERNLPRFAAARVASAFGSGRGADGRAAPARRRRPA